MNPGQSIRRGSAWVLGGNVSIQILQFVIGVVLARLLAPGDFGILVTIQVFTGVAGFLASGGMGQALIRAKHIDARHSQVVFSFQLISGLLIYATLFLCSPLISRAYDNPIYEDLIRVSALSFIFRPFANVPSALLQREMRFKRRTVWNLLAVPIGSVASIALASNGHGPWSLVLGGLVSSATLALLGIITYPNIVRLRLESSIVKEMGAYSAKLTLNDIVCYLRTQTSNFLIGIIAGPSSVGLYNKADSLSKLPQTISGAVYDPIFRGLSVLAGDSSQSKYIYYRAIALLSVYMLPIYFGLMWLAEPFILFVYGEKWLPAALPLQVLCAGGIFACIGHPAGAVLAANNWLGRELIVQICATGLVAAACIGGIRWGLLGVAYGLLFAWAYSTLHLAILCNQCIGARIPDVIRSLGPALALSSAMNIALLLFHTALGETVGGPRSPTYLIAMTFVGILTYGILFLFAPIPTIASEAGRWRKSIIKIARIKR